MCWLTPKFEWGSCEKCSIPKSGFSSQSGGGVEIGLEGFVEDGELDADEVDTFEEAESDACSPTDASCELGEEGTFVDCVVRARTVFRTGRAP